MVNGEGVEDGTTSESKGELTELADEHGATAARMAAASGEVGPVPVAKAGKDIAEPLEARGH